MLSSTALPYHITHRHPHIMHLITRATKDASICEANDNGSRTQRWLLHHRAASGSSVTWQRRCLGPSEHIRKVHYKRGCQVNESCILWDYLYVSLPNQSLHFQITLLDHSIKKHLWGKQIWWERLFDPTRGQRCPRWKNSKHEHEWNGLGWE